MTGNSTTDFKVHMYYQLNLVSQNTYYFNYYIPVPGEIRIQIL